MSAVINQYTTIVTASVDETANTIVCEITSTSINNTVVFQYGQDGATGATGAQGPTGPQGVTGETGATGSPGQGVPTGGTTGQVLKKIDATDYNTEWGDNTAISVISGTAIINFGNENDWAVTTVSNASIVEAIKSFSYIPTGDSTTSLDDFAINGVSFSIENIIGGVSFDIRGTAINNATGNYTITYKILI